jgi:hypothetical protein
MYYVVGHWVTWVMGQWSDGSHGSWATIYDPLSALHCTYFAFIYHSLRVISEIQCVNIQPEVTFATRGRDTSEMISPFDLSKSLLYRLSFDILCQSLSVEKLFNIFHLAGESPLWIKVGGFLEILNPLAKFAETATPKSD